MNARIVELLPETDSLPMACLEMPAGRATFRIRTRISPLIRGADYSAEFEVNDPIEMGRNALPAKTDRFMVEERDGHILMTGLVDGVEPDGLVFFRLGADSLTMLDAAPGQFKAGCWLTLEFDAARIAVYLT